MQLTPLILASGETSIMTFVLWAIILLVIFFARRWLGRTLFGLAFGISMLFFTVFLIDNYTGNNLRNFIDISFYDKTLEDPQGVVNEVVDKAKEGGKDLSDKINSAGSDLDDKLGISKKEDGKTWDDVQSSTEPENPDLEVSNDNSTGNTSEELTNANEFFITYSEISKLLSNELSFLSKEDKSLIKSMSPSLKTEFEGTNIIVSNTDKELFKENKLKITVYI